MSTDNKSNTESIEWNLVKHWKSLKERPRIIVFDLDHTLRPYNIDCQVEPPFKKLSNSNILDNAGYEYKPFKDVTKILRS